MTHTILIIVGPVRELKSRTGVSEIRVDFYTLTRNGPTKAYALRLFTKAWGRVKYCERGFTELSLGGGVKNKRSLK